MQVAYDKRRMGINELMFEAFNSKQIIQESKKNEYHKFLYATTSREKLTRKIKREHRNEMRISPPVSAHHFFLVPAFFGLIRDELRDTREKSYSTYKENSAATITDHSNGKPLKHYDGYKVG